jgi:hypothetical protein
MSDSIEKLTELLADGYGYRGSESYAMADPNAQSPYTVILSKKGHDDIRMTFKGDNILKAKLILKQ